VVKTAGCVMYRCGSSLTELSIFVIRIIIQSREKNKVNKLLSAFNNEQVV
jgi:hypothetical protein